MGTMTAIAPLPQATLTTPATPATAPQATTGRERIFLLGYPGNCGGANTEAWYTIKLWLGMGLNVTLIPTWGNDSVWEKKLDAVGAKTIHVRPDQLSTVPGLAGNVVVGMCNPHFMKSLGVLKGMGCKTIWLNCMTTVIFDEERQAARNHGLCDAYLFQSQFQRQEIESRLIPVGYTPERGFLIRGAFDPGEFSSLQPRGHVAGEDFIIGRIARPDLDKLSPRLWPILAAVPYPRRKFIIMGWTDHSRVKCGQTPEWAECLLPQQIPVADFLPRCHAMLGLNGGARENWPRIGLEAMAAGVPVVAEGKWGWCEMIEHGRTGIRSDGEEEFAYYLAKLAYEEEWRQGIIVNAREAVKRLCDPEVLGRQWQEMIEFVKTGQREQKR
jgi:hypothetical protein